jgi:hypothetical protein
VNPIDTVPPGGIEMTPVGSGMIQGTFDEGVPVAIAVPMFRNVALPRGLSPREAEACPSPAAPRPEA